ncbi:RNB domain-containing ribonuclease [Skermania piniformis]|uniref:RNB domain-containing ribonuclease n=1 Tax=Skermania pinensis TaxID=39122 RepID=A0ABX8SAW9_9ACTN|nr:RNB domain-containing ribonuclease [Skermania piniformis]QXQ15010.1 RNB domain-containing ribonuclease [Skermania piniformis]
MSVRRLAAAELEFGSIRTEFGLVSDFPDAALAEAEHAVDAFSAVREDRVDLPFVTIDPPGSMDLDQALHLQRTASGFVVHYAIADLGAVVVPGGALDTEVRRRGQTYYLPDGSIPLHPPVLSAGNASLLPEQDRPVALWTIECDERAQPQTWSVRRARVRSVARLDYAGVQADADAGRLHPSIAALPEFGALRLAAAAHRGAIELNLPEQVVIRDGDAGWRLELEPRTAADEWNAQVSLLTGMCAAALMVSAELGLLRTMPPPDAAALAGIRRAAKALGLDWPADVPVGRLLAALPTGAPTTLAVMSEATGLLRGAGYTVLDGSLPEQVSQSAIGAPYTHVTAPLRRLTDRFTTEICLALSAATPVPDWVRAGLSEVAEVMRYTDALAGKVERACVDRAEATVLADRVGSDFPAVVLRGKDGRRDAEVFVADPPVVARCDGDPPDGAQLTVRLQTADIDTRTVRFAYRPADSAVPAEINDSTAG